MSPVHSSAIKKAQVHYFVQIHNLHSDINQAYLVVAGMHKHLSLIRMQFDVIDAILLYKKIENFKKEKKMK